MLEEERQDIACKHVNVADAEVLAILAPREVLCHAMRPIGHLVHL